MKFIIRPFSEIMIKSKPVRKRYLNYLQTNTNLSIKKIDESLKARYIWDSGVVYTNEKLNDFQVTALKKSLSRIPGIESFIEVVEYDYIDFDDVFLKAKDFYLDKIEGKSFVVRIKRRGTHDFKSIDLERYVGGGLLKNSKNSSVSVKKPDIIINIEIKDQKLYLVKEKYFGVGGYPTGTQDKVLSLISGGFDSGVSTFSMMKRGAKVDYLFFNLGGNAHELGVKQVSNYLWNNFSQGYRAKFITVNFEEVVAELIKNTDHKYRAIILKRLFLKVADKIAKEYEYFGIVKGDSLGQVSSQTLKNMYVIDKASDTLVLRPLITFNKQDIVDISREIGTYESACNMPEYCGVISDKPATGAKLEKVEKEESRFDFSVLDKALENVKVEKIDEVLEKETENGQDIDVKYIPEDNDIVIDIRESVKIEKEPLILDKVEIKNIEFFDINYDFEKLDQSKNYLLYCDKGILSKLHGLYLKEKGFKNVAIFRPVENDSSCKIG